MLSAALKSMGSRFVTGYVGLAEGEKDPRNLVVSFAIVRVLLIEFDVSAQVDVRSRHLIVENYLADILSTEYIRYYVLLFPDNLQSPTWRPLRYLNRGPKGRLEVRVVGINIIFLIHN